uniref:protein phosphatase inhibitor 2 family member C-like n=1 Tax=Jaculus jaculus TaxID=51337 RepID=UPI001E1B0EDA|nr:protein phosphatase inhibitor 2 family member C-like [Jaculus jaculus]
MLATSTTSHNLIKGKSENTSPSATFVEDSAQQSGRPGTLESQQNKLQTWDESNILATHHLSYKHYDLMKMNELRNPYLNVPHDEEVTVSEIKGKEAMGIFARKPATTDTFGLSCQVEEQGSSMGHSSKFLLDKEE